MVIVYYLISIIITIIIIYIIGKYYPKLNDYREKYKNIKQDNLKKDTNKNNANIDLNKENLGIFYNHGNNSTNINNEDYSNIRKNNLLNTPKQNQNTNIGYSTSNQSYNDKNIFGYLYQLPFIKNRLVIIDTEVAGISSLDHIIELSAFEMIDGKLTSQYYHSFLNPKKKLNPSIIRKHKIPKNVFKYTYEQEKQIFEEFLNFINNSIIIAHNAIFDMEKINYELNFYDLPLIDKHQFRCSMRIFFDKYRHLSNKFSKLSECCDFLGIRYIEDNLHLAYYDALLLGKIMEKIYAKEYSIVFGEKNIDNCNLINNLNENKNNTNEEDESFNNKLKNININYAIEAGSTEKTSFDKMIDENIDDIYKDLEEQETTDKIIDFILNEDEKNNAFNKYVNDNIDDIYTYLKNEDEKEDN